jgi:serine/threonine-protein kinase
MPAVKPAKTESARKRRSAGPAASGAAAAAPTSRYLAWGVAGVVLLAVVGFGIKSFTKPRAAAVESALPLAADAAANTGVAVPAAPAAPEPAASAAVAPLSPASKAAAALAVAARKAAQEKERLAKQQAAQAKAAAATPAAATEHATAPAPAATSGNPKQACEDRMLIGFQICMSEQCAKPAFTNHPVCVERRAMEQRRRDAEQLRR